MKKASKLLWVLLVAMLSMVLVIGCGGEDSGDETKTESPWKVIYLPLVDGTSVDRAVNTMHLHLNNGSVEIQKVFVNTTKSTTGAKYILDFTQNAGTAPNIYWGDAGGYWYHKDGDVAAFNAFVQDGGTANGRFVFTGTGYVYGGAFASGAAYDNNANFYGFVIKKDTVLGDSRVKLFTADGEVADPEGTVRFESMVE